MRVYTLTTIFFAVALLAVMSAVSSCGSSDGGKPQSIASPEQVNNLVEMRKIFDKVGGKWESLTTEDRAAFTKLAGDDGKAQSMWKTMSTPMGASAPG